MSGIDAFLDLCDADPDWDSGDEDDDPFARLVTNAPKDNKVDTDKAKANAHEHDHRSFSEMFGMPHRVPGGSGQKVPCPSNDSKITNVRPKPVTQAQKPHAQTDHVLDPHSKLRLIKSTIRLETDAYGVIEDSLKGRNIGAGPFMPLAKIGTSGGGSSGPGQKSEFWTSGVLTKKIPGSRTSANGNSYSLWELHDLEAESVPKFTLFLFGGTGDLDSVKCIPIGSLVDFIGPRAMGEGKLSVSASNQIRLIGTTKDFGTCGATRKDGTPCTNVVNQFKCPVCIHHVTKELRKEKGKSKNNGNGKGKNFKPWGNRSGGLLPMNAGLPEPGVVTTNFGNIQRQNQEFTPGISAGPAKKKTEFTIGTAAKKNLLQEVTITAPANKKPRQAAAVRMELQDPTNTLKRTPVSMGNHSSINFLRQDSKCGLLEQAYTAAVAPEPLKLDPNKTRHLSESERELLLKLDEERLKTKSKLPTLLVAPNASSKNFLKFLELRNPDSSEGSNSGSSGGNSSKSNNAQSFLKKNPGSSTLTSTSSSKSPGSSTSTLRPNSNKNMSTALNILKKIGPIVKSDPNSVKASTSKKRKFDELELTDDPVDIATAKKQKEEQEFQKILNAKSSHSALVEDNQETDYFAKSERKEALESKLLSTWNVPVTAVLCKSCKYIAVSQSDYCKENRHSIRMVKATKRFFSCKNCSKRTMCLDRLPKFSCPNCQASAWTPAPMGSERKVTLESEKLCIRGDEERYLGSAGSKMFL